MPLIYVHWATIPERKARTIQAINTSLHIAKLGIEVFLIVEGLKETSRKSLFKHYGIEDCQRLKIVQPSRQGIEETAGAIVRSLSPQDAIFYCRNLRTANLLIGLSKRTAVPLVYEAHKIAFMDVADEARIAGLKPRKVRRKLLRTFNAENTVFQEARAVVCTSQAVASLAKTCFGRAEDVIVVRNGGPEPVQGPGASSSEAAPPRSSGGEAPRRIVYVGSLGAWKGTDALFGAMRTLDGFQLVIAGPVTGSMAPDGLGDREASLLAEGRLSMRGYLAPAEVMPFLSSEEFVVAALPVSGSYSAQAMFFTSPLKLFQYLAAGIPVVASDVPALREVLRHRQNAYLVKPDDPDALAEGIKAVAFDGKLTLNLIANGFETAREFSWHNRAERLASFLRRLSPGV